MPRYRITVTEFAEITDRAAGAPAETEMFKLVVDQFDAVAFMKAVTAQPRRRRKQKVAE